MVFLPPLEIDSLELFKTTCFKVSQKLIQKFRHIYFDCLEPSKLWLFQKVNNRLFVLNFLNGRRSTDLFQPHTINCVRRSLQVIASFLIQKLKQENHIVSTGSSVIYPKIAFSVRLPPQKKRKPIFLYKTNIQPEILQVFIDTFFITR